MLGVCLSAMLRIAFNLLNFIVVHPSARRISLGGEGNALYSVLSNFIILI